jgi:hypothetical protein
VLVNLDALYPPPEQPTQDDGRVLRGWAPGALSGWLKADDGSGIGVVTYLMTMYDGSTDRAERRLVPSEALRPQ